MSPTRRLSAYEVSPHPQMLFKGLLDSAFHRCSCFSQEALGQMLSPLLGALGTELLTPCGICSDPPEANLACNLENTADTATPLVHVMVSFSRYEETTTTLSWIGFFFLC